MVPKKAEKCAPQKCKKKMCQNAETERKREEFTENAEIEGIIQKLGKKSKNWVENAEIE